MVRTKLSHFYAVHRGKKPGIYRSWEDCEKQVTGFKGARYKKFKTAEEAEYFQQFGREQDPLSLNPGAAKAKTKTKTTSSVAASVPAASKAPAAIPPYIKVYTDGSSRGNGKVGAVAGYGVYYGENDPNNVAEPLPGKIQTNQRAELTAVVRALQDAKKRLEKEKVGVEILTDSKYSIDCFTSWCLKWERNGYKNNEGLPVKNADLIKAGRELMHAISDDLRQHDLYQGVKFTHVKGHSNIPGNEMADRLANLGADKALRRRET